MKTKEEVLKDLRSICFVNKSEGINIIDAIDYIEPSIHDKFMASLSDEQKKMYEEMKATSPK